MPLDVFAKKDNPCNFIINRYLFSPTGSGNFGAQVSRFSGNKRCKGKKYLQ